MNNVVAYEGRDEQVVVYLRGEVVDAEPFRVDLGHGAVVNEETTVGQEADKCRFRKKSERSGTDLDVHVLDVVVGVRDRQVRVDGEVVRVVPTNSRCVWKQLKLVDI